MSIKLFVIHLSIYLLILSNPGYARLNTGHSNDPLGSIFIKKSFGDVSNCGPIAALMARNFAQKSFAVRNLSSTIKSARRTVKPVLESNDDDVISATSSDTSWWKINDIKKYLRKNKVSHSSLNINKGKNRLVEEIDKGHVMIINLNMNSLSRSFGSIGKPYFTFPIPGGWGHYLLIVGYEYKGKKLVFYTHDSFSKSGKNRKYYADNIIDAVKSYNPHIIVVGNNQETVNKRVRLSH